MLAALGPFSDSTTELETLDGQYFWRSVYSANEIELTSESLKKIWLKMRNSAKPEGGR